MFCCLCYRQVTLRKTSKNSPRPIGREPSELLALGVNIGGIRIERDKSRKLKYLKRVERDYATHRFRFQVNKFVCRFVPVGSVAPCATISPVLNHTIS